MAVISTRARAFASPSPSSLRTCSPASPRSCFVMTVALTSTPWMTTCEGTSRVSFFSAYSCIFAITSGRLMRLTLVVP